MKAKLTKQLVESVKPHKKRDVFLWDSELPRFGVKVTPAGRRVYIAQYRGADGRTRRLTLGRHGTVTIDEARKKAREKLSAATLGEDPAAEKLDARRSPTIEELGGRYLREHAETKKKATSIGNDRWLLDKVVYPNIGTLKVLSIGRIDVAALHDRLKARPCVANRAVALLSKMMNLAEKWGLRPDGSNPCRHVEKYRERKRRRFLSAEELARLGAALAEAENENQKAGSKVLTLPPAAVAAIRLLIFTGARVSEILTAKWKYLNHELSALVLPESKTGFKIIPLNAPARAVLDRLPMIEGNPYIIPGLKEGSHLVGLGHMWNRIRRAAEIPDVRLHDLRHSYASVGAAAGLGLPIIGALLGHADQTTTQRYAHLAADPLKAAAELIGSKIDAAMKAKPKLRRMK